MVSLGRPLVQSFALLRLRFLLAIEYTCPMKNKKLLPALTVFLVSLAVVGASPLPQGEKKDKANAAKLDVLKMKAIPDGYYLMEMNVAGTKRLLNFEAKGGKLTCVGAEQGTTVGMSGQAMLIGNGVFSVRVRNKNHAASQFWVFGTDGNGKVKEFPDRGENQRLWRVADGTVLKRPEE